MRLVEQPLCGGLFHSGAGARFGPRYNHVQRYGIAPGCRPGTYTVTITDADACKQVLQIALMQPAPLISLGIAADTACPGVSNGGLHFLGASQGTPPYTLQWSTGVAAPDITGLAAGTYDLLLTDAHGCTLVQNATIPTYSAPAIDMLLELGQYVYLMAVTNPPGMVPVGINWSPANAGLLPDVLQQKTMPEETTEFEVEITDGQGCRASDRVLVEVVNYQIYTPNAISTGAQGNDWFTLYAGSGIREIKLLQVSDRWGELLFENRRFAPNDPAAGWDGRFRTSWVAPGVFIWYAELEGKDGRIVHRTGDVTVVRKN